MELHRFFSTGRRGCRNSLNAHTAIADAGAVYGSDREYLQRTLREPGTCRLREAKGGFLPLTTEPDGNGQFLLIAGDVRVSEHAFLAAQHIVWLREHNRLCDVVESRKEFNDLTPDEKFERVRNVIVGKFQQVMLTEFLPALGITQDDLENAEAKFDGNGIGMEFSIAYRVGHDLIGNSVGNIDVVDAFGAEVLLSKLHSCTLMNIPCDTILVGTSTAYNGGYLHCRTRRATTRAVLQHAYVHRTRWQLVLTSEYRLCVPHLCFNGSLVRR